MTANGAGGDGIACSPLSGVHKKTGNLRQAAGQSTRQEPVN